MKPENTNNPWHRVEPGEEVPKRQRILGYYIIGNGSALERMPDCQGEVDCLTDIRVGVVYRFCDYEGFAFPGSHLCQVAPPPRSARPEAVHRRRSPPGSA